MPADKRSLESRILDGIADKACFDVGDLIDRLSVSEDWSKLIVAHIYLDHIVSQTLVDHLPHHESYLSGYRPFMDKLSLCQALGYFQSELGAVLKSINASRNKFAHNLVFDFSDTEKKNLFRVFTKELPLSEILRPDGLTDFLIMVVLLTELSRVSEAKRRELANIESELMSEMFDDVRRMLRRR